MYISIWNPLQQQPRTTTMPVDCQKNLYRAVRCRNTDEQNEFGKDPMADWTGEYIGEAEEWEEKHCICGQPHIKYLNGITNQVNGEKLQPIGSSCIKRFMPADQWDKVQAEQGAVDATCPVCEGPKFKCDQLCTDCFINHSEIIRGKVIHVKEMDRPLLAWLVRKHPRFQKGKLRRMLIKHIKHVEDVHATSL